MTPKHPPGPPMDLANMRRQGVHHLIAYYHNDACRDQAIIDVSKYPDDVEVPSFQRRIKCGKCGRQARRHAATGRSNHRATAN